jgi:hypothetical protein
MPCRRASLGRWPSREFPRRTIGVDDQGRLAFVSTIEDVAFTTRYRYSQNHDIHVPEEADAYTVTDAETADNILGAALGFP